MLGHLGVLIHLGPRLQQRVPRACWQLAVLCVRAVLQLLQAMHVPRSWLLLLSVPVTDSEVVYFVVVLCPRAVLFAAL